MLWKLTQLQEKSEPILHVPSRANVFSIERVELVEAKAHFLTGGRDAEYFAQMCTADLGSHADPARLLDHVVNDDLNIWKCVCDASYNGLDAFGASALPGGQRNVFPGWIENFVDKIGILVVKSPIEG